jgi:hypothetical protein
VAGEQRFDLEARWKIEMTLRGQRQGFCITPNPPRHMASSTMIGYRSYHRPRINSLRLYYNWKLSTGDLAAKRMAFAAVLYRLPTLLLKQLLAALTARGGWQ